MSRFLLGKSTRIAVLVFSCALLSAGLVESATASPPEFRLTQVNQRVFWNGANVTRSGPDDWVQATTLAETGAAACQHPDIQCFDYALETGAVPTGAELRVALDHPSPSDAPPAAASLELFGFVVTGPARPDGSRQSAKHTGLVNPGPGPNNVQLSSRR